ncbi:hypothetical protein [Lysobacter capsici]|nr:hypothetical protein [Lysobacter capsici]
MIGLKVRASAGGNAIAMLDETQRTYIGDVCREDRRPDMLLGRA